MWTKNIVQLEKEASFVAWIITYQLSLPSVLFHFGGAAFSTEKRWPDPLGEHPGAKGQMQSTKWANLTKYRKNLNWLPSKPLRCLGTLSPTLGPDLHWNNCSYLCFGQYPQAMTRGEDQNVDRLINVELHLYHNWPVERPHHCRTCSILIA